MVAVTRRDNAVVSTSDVTASRSRGLRNGNLSRVCLQGVPGAVGKVLRRRYFLVEKARNASIVGILVGTLGVAGYLDVVDRVRELAKRCARVRPAAPHTTI